MASSNFIPFYLSFPKFPLLNKMMSRFSHRGYLSFSDFMGLISLSHVLFYAHQRWFSLLSAFLKAFRCFILLYTAIFKERRGDLLEISTKIR